MYGRNENGNIKNRRMNLTEINVIELYLWQKEFVKMSNAVASFPYPFLFYLINSFLGHLYHFIFQLMCVAVTTVTISYCFFFVQIIRIENSPFRFSMVITISKKKSQILHCQIA